MSCKKVNGLGFDQLQQWIFQRQNSLSAPWITLATAPTLQLSIDATGIVPLTEDNVQPSQLTNVVVQANIDAAGGFPVGASARNQSGLQCLEAGGLAIYTQTTDDGVTYDQQIDEYGVEDNVMTLEGSVALTLTSPIDDGQIFVAGGFDCGELSLF